MLLTNKGILIISDPKHEVNYFVEVHLSSCHLTYFMHNLIHAGFDCKKGKHRRFQNFKNIFVHISFDLLNLKCRSKIL